MTNKLLPLLLFIPLFACGEHKPLSSLSITNGRDATEADYPSVVRLLGTRAGTSCGGTFIGEGLVLTAAHCVYGTNNGVTGDVGTSMELVPNQPGAPRLTSTQVTVHPAWQNTVQNSKYASPYDMAVVKFPDAVDYEISTIIGSAVRSGAQVELVGFGSDDASNPNASVGNKRIGRNKIALVQNNLLILYGSGTSSNTSGTATNSSMTKGDSGSALFSEGKLAGVGLLANYAPPKSSENQYMDLNSPIARAFLKGFLQ